MKLNLGCGFHKLEGWSNIDKIPNCHPDLLIDLERFPWPWPDSCVDAVLLRHVLEHVGDARRTFLKFVKELWRVCRPGAEIEIVVPHPRCDEFLWDPTHVRPITPEGLRMFSQVRNHQMISENKPETPLAIYLAIDFDVIRVRYIWRKPWSEHQSAGVISDQDLHELLGRQWNVAKEIEITLKVVKPVRFPDAIIH